MTRLAKLIAPVGLVLAATAVLPAHAQVDGRMATVDVSRTIIGSTAFQAAYEQVNTTYASQNELRRRGEAPYTGAKANAVFRKGMIYSLVDAFGISVASACTHYNDALHFVRDLNAELVSGLGRPPEKNNGGRKKKVVETPATVALPSEETALLLLEGTPEPQTGATEEELLQMAVTPVVLEEAPF